MAPPQVTAIDEVDLRSLSDLDISKLWVATLKDRDVAELTPLVLKEFRRRFWQRAEEHAAYGTSCSLPTRTA